MWHVKGQLCKFDFLSSLDDRSYVLSSSRCARMIREGYASLSSFISAWVKTLSSVHSLPPPVISVVCPRVVPLRIFHCHFTTEAKDHNVR